MKTKILVVATILATYSFAKEPVKIENKTSNKEATLITNTIKNKAIKPLIQETTDKAVTCAADAIAKNVILGGMGINVPVETLFYDCMK